VKQTALAVVGGGRAQEWARRINRSMAESVAAILATGRAFIDAKAQLKHGEFERLFKGHENAVAEPVQCSARTARMFMTIATHPMLSDRKHASVLPASWYSLYELTKLPASTLRKALADGRVHPGMRRREVTKIKEADPTAPVPIVAPGAGGWDRADAGDRLQRAAERELSTYGARPEDRPVIAYLLRQVARGFDT
jgi:hypothetical protein